MGYVERAAKLAIDRLPTSLEREVGKDFHAIVRGLIPSLAAAIGIVAASAAVGAGLGAAVGSLAFGVGAAPGAALGARLGLQFGFWVLTYLGIAFLLAYVVEHLGDVGAHLQEGIRRAWRSCGEGAALDAAAEDLATGIAVLLSLILQAIVAYLLKQALSGRFGMALARLKSTRLFNRCAELELWLNRNFVRLLKRHNIQSKIVIVPGESAPSLIQVLRSLKVASETVRALAPGGRPAFRSVAELDAALRARGFRLIENTRFGPDLPDARQLLYQGPESTLVKIKTRGYGKGLRPNGTMSIEVTDGRGTGWANTLFKLDTEGGVIPKNVVGKQNVIETADGYMVKPPVGDLRPATAFEVLEAGGVKPIDPNQFADFGHLDFSSDFNPAGAADLLPK